MNYTDYIKQFIKPKRNDDGVDACAKAISLPDLADALHYSDTTYMFAADIPELKIDGDEMLFSVDIDERSIKYFDIGSDMTPNQQLQLADLAVRHFTKIGKFYIVKNRYGPTGLEFNSLTDLITCIRAMRNG